MTTPILRALILLAALPAIAAAQLTPERLYHGIGQRIPVQVHAPDGFTGEATIRLYDPRFERFTHTATAAVGRVDLASLLPTLWQDQPAGVLYAQLELDAVPTGAPLVLDPMITPDRAALVNESTLQPAETRDAKVMFESERKPELFKTGRADKPERDITYSGLRVYTDHIVHIDTTLGQITARLRPDAAPNTAFNFLHLVKGGFYTDVIFHRVVAALPTGEPFVIQAGGQFMPAAGPEEVVRHVVLASPLDQDRHSGCLGRIPEIVAERFLG